MGAVKVEKVIMKYEFGLATGETAIGTHKVGILPAGATITKSWIDVDTTFTSATDAGTIGLGITGSVSLFETPAAISVGTAWDAAVPRVASVGIGVVASYSVVATDVQVIVVVAVEALTAGKDYLYIEYVVNA